jgi:hypothetical protein
VLKRIQFLAEKGLTSLMVLSDFLSRCIAPLQQCAFTARLYTRENDATQLEHGHETDLSMKVMDTMLLKLCSDPISNDFINPLSSCLPIFMD